MFSFSCVTLAVDDTDFSPKNDPGFFQTKINKRKMKKKKKDF
jgi:hypothetical protein